MKKINKMKSILSAIILTSTLLVGCGQETGTNEEVTTTNSSQVKEVEKVDQNEYKSFEIENNEQLLMFTEAPKRAVTLNQHVTEVMLALGLEEFMVGTAYLDDAVLPEFKEAYESIPVLSDRYPSQEVFLAEEPDFAYAGWGSAFREDNIGTVEQLKEFGVNAYLHESSSKVGPTIDDIYSDILNVARIFNVEERGAQLIASMEEELSKIQKNIPQITEKKKVFVFDSGDTAPFTVAQNFLNSLITLAGAENIFSEIDKNWAEVSWEEVVDRDPEVIIIVDYGETTAEEKKETLLRHPALEDVTGIKNENFIVIPLSAVAEGIRAPYALEILVNGLYK
ncbi:ABC transporter substrate-binding protein [Alkalihalobacterium chitinilyticum]|uniref:ABC transporter substrate-binding protein n=1 Tax=Alkalihalobacterium chitinilyticum TaxID=2980103 RepID=A0ABT5VCF0_9BACI|nr:ABC transporter substrate-binding protein [Alkalihalobacterium chitinilyticum]MDE5412153.1 ABC transporter substrate-binding protein [Alkalihalobacterium chitinilyticum]